MCGNYSKKALKMRINAGSPPRVRELLHVTKNVVNSRRITPACAGITHAIFKTQFFAEDHPRVCGNYSDKKRESVRKVGSPPRVRELQILCL